MNTSFSGGCTCGAVRYECASAPLAMLNCHCRDCQRASGAPFASGVIVRAADLKVTGEPQTYAVRASSGGLSTRSFCGICGAPLFAQGELVADFMSIRFSTMDDASAFTPQLDIWTGSAQPWVCFAGNIPQYPTSP